MTPRVFFFGLWPGSHCHCLHESSGAGVWHPERIPGLPAALWNLDCVWARATPRTDAELRTIHRERDPQTQGLAPLRHVDGWTVAAWWDRSEADRGSSNACFLVDREIPLGDVLGLAREHFPRVMARMEAAYEIRAA